MFALQRNALLYVFLMAYSLLCVPHANVFTVTSISQLKIMQKRI